jgi:hypothetical protein
MNAIEIFVQETDVEFDFDCQPGLFTGETHALPFRNIAILH